MTCTRTNNPVSASVALRRRTVDAEIATAGEELMKNKTPWSREMKDYFGTSMQKVRAAMQLEGACLIEERWYFPSEESFRRFATVATVASSLPPPGEVTLPVTLSSNAAQQTFPLLVATGGANAVCALEESAEPPSTSIATAEQVTEMEVIRSKMELRTKLGMGAKRLALEPSCMMLIHSHAPEKSWGRAYTISTRKVRAEVQAGETDGSRDTTKDVLVVESNTIKTVVNPEEAEKAAKLRSRLRGRLASFGTTVAPGLVALPIKDRAAFLEMEKEVLMECIDFNSTSRNYDVSVGAIELVVVASNEAKIAARVTWEIRSLLDGMNAALLAADSKGLENLAQQAKIKAAAMAAGSARGAVLAAVNDAKAAATKIATAAKKVGVDMQAVVARLDTRSIESASLMMLEYDIPEELTSVPGASENISGLEDISPEVTESLAASS